MGTARQQAVRRHPVRHRLLAVALSLPLTGALAACGGGGGSSDTTAVAETTAAPETTAVSETTAAPDTTSPSETTAPADTTPATSVPSTSGEVPSPTFTGAAADVQKAFLARVDAYNRGDGAAFVKTYATSRLDQLAGQAAGIDAQVSATHDDLKVLRILSIDVKGATATVVFESTTTPRLSDAARLFPVSKGTETWVAEAGVWKVDTSQSGPPDIPASVLVADVRVPDGAPIEIPPAIPTNQPAAFRFVNAGAGTHRVYLLRLADGVDLPTYLRKLADPATKSPGPEGTQIADSGELATKTEHTVLLSGPLPAGRYLLVCGAGQTTDAPHALKEYVTFDVAG